MVARERQLLAVLHEVPVTALNAVLIAPVRRDVRRRPHEVPPVVRARPQVQHGGAPSTNATIAMTAQREPIAHLDVMNELNVKIVTIIGVAPPQGVAILDPARGPMLDRTLGPVGDRSTDQVGDRAVDLAAALTHASSAQSHVRTHASTAATHDLVLAVQYADLDQIRAVRDSRIVIDLNARRADPSHPARVATRALARVAHRET